MTIRDVQQQPSGLWLITDDRGRQYATTSAWKASIAQRAKEQGKAVAITDGRGWFYRNLIAIAIVDQKEQCA
jgi:hypothetical protein